MYHRRLIATLLFLLLKTIPVSAGSCGGLTHPNIQVNPDGDFGLVPSQFSAVCEFSTDGVGNGYMAQDLTLSNNVLWLLKGVVQVGLNVINGAQNPVTDPSASSVAAVLTIAAGTVIAADLDVLSSDGSLDGLVIHRGSKLIANGSIDQPIRFASLNKIVSGVGAPGQWSGIAINGYGRINNCSSGLLIPDCEVSAPLALGKYGGNNDDDSSGLLRYVIIEDAGYVVSPAQAFNALSLNALGKATTVEALHIVNSAATALVINGGDVDLSQVILSQSAGTGLQWSDGWSGSIQQLLVDGGSSGKHAIEGGNSKNMAIAEVALPRSSPLLANVSIIHRAAPAAVSLFNHTAASMFGLVIDNPDGICFARDNVGLDRVEMSFSMVSCNSFAMDAVSIDWFEQAELTLSSSELTLNGYLNTQLVADFPIIGMPVLPDLARLAYIGAVGFCEDDWTQGWALDLPAVDSALCPVPTLAVPLDSTVSILTLTFALGAISHWQLRSFP